MLIKALSHVLFAASVVNFFPVDAAILELQAGVSMPTDTVASTFMYGPKAALPVAQDKLIPPPTKLDLQSFGVVTTAQSALVIDAASGVPLFAKNANEVRSIGSISKLMTALVFLDTQPNLNKYVTVTADDFAGTGRVYLYYDDAVLLEDVLGASMVGSDNTATMALVRLSGLSLDEFVARMNAKAIKLGMPNSKFADPSGLSALNVSTVGELAVLLAEAKRHPEIAGFMKTATLNVEQASGRVALIPSTNQLLTSPLNTGTYQVTAGKTGYIPQAGYCLATAVQHAGDEVYIVVLGADQINSRFEDALDLASWTFNTFEWQTL